MKRYEFIEQLTDGDNSLRIVMKDDRWGAVDFNGKEKIPLIFSSLKRDKIGIRCRYNKNEGLFDFCGNQLIKPEYDNICEVRTFKYCETYGKREIKYEELIGFKVMKKTEGHVRYGLLDTDGKLIIPVEYCEIMTDYDSAQNRFIVKKAEKYGAINRKGEIIIPLQYDSIKLMGNYYLGLDSSSKNIHDQTGKKLLCAKGHEIYANLNIRKHPRSMCEDWLDRLNEQWSKDWFYIEDSKKLWGIFDCKQKKMICEVKYKNIRETNGGFLVDTEDGRGLIDLNGNEILPCIYADVGQFTNGYRAIKKKGEAWGYIDSKGKEVTRFIYAVAGPVDENGRAEVRWDLGWRRYMEGFILLK